MAIMIDPLEFTIALAQRAGSLLLELSSKDITMQVKRDRTVITQADLSSHELLITALHQAFPQDLVISEEGNPALSLEKADPTSAIWLVDPLDGTTNYGLGLPIWGVLLCRLEQGFPVLSVMYFPRLNELYYAQRGHGAFLNGKPLQVEQPSPDRPFSFFVCCSRTIRHYQVEIPYKARILGSTAYSLCCVARGIALLGFEATPKIWDLAGGWLTVQEAGGVIETYDGSQPFPFRGNLADLDMAYPTLAAANQDLLARGRKQITRKLKL